jgi:nucleoside-diphosphate-sugar epimerase
MKLVITGALGHIGSRLIRELPAAFPDAEIVMLDDFSTQRYSSLFNLPEGRYRFHEVDVLRGSLDAIEGADAVIHLAAVTDAVASFEQRDRVEQVNYEATDRVARACAATGAGLIFLSTTSVYGTQAEVVDEACSVDELKPQSPYAEAKLKSERLLTKLGDELALRFVTLRFGTIYGVSPGMRFHTAVNKFIWQACMGQPITVWRAALQQRRPYLDLEDGVRALVFLLRQERFDRQIYNVLTENLTVEDVINAIREHIAGVAVKYVDSPIMNQLSYHVRCDKFRALGFEFSGGIQRGVADTVRLLRNAGTLNHASN